MIEFSCPWALFLLFLPLLVLSFPPIAQKICGDALKVPFVQDIIKIKTMTTQKYLQIPANVLRSFQILLLSLIWILAVIALCRPQWVGEPHRVRNEGRDILLVVDISTSMLERDFTYNNHVFDRLTAVKNVVSQFADKRTEDRIGLVLFGTRAYLQVPLTYDREALKKILWSTDAGMAGDSTSIGDAVGVAVKNMRENGDNKENKVIILLTDGENNDGYLSLLQAVDLAQQEKVKVYTIGVSSDTRAFFGGLLSVPVNSGLDENSLKKLAQATRGNYFRAKDVRSLSRIYDEIDKLEPQEHEGRVIRETKDLFYIPVTAVLVLFIILILLMKRRV